MAPIGQRLRARSPEVQPRLAASVSPRTGRRAGQRVAHVLSARNRDARPPWRERGPGIADARVRPADRGRGAPLPALMAKRALDIAIAAPALVLLAPVLVLVAIAVRLSMGPPAVFRHRRAGYQGRPFTLLKFRTMRPGVRGEPDDSRLTRLGALLRACSLDELPQLW
ncbi:MAG: sugar transferase, partial [Deltaproteobacteria bacterium]